MIKRLMAMITPQALILLALLLLIPTALRSQTTKQTESLEQRMEKTLSRIEGAGRVSVVIAQRSAEQETPSLLMKENGASAGSIPCGAAVVAQGADDPIVHMQLTQAVCAVLGLPASAVSVSDGM